MHKNKDKNETDYWDHIYEYEIDSSWLNATREKFPRYDDYRANFAKAQKRTYTGNFPLALEIEASYYCNLKCPYCPRVPGANEMRDGHLDMELVKKIISEAKKNKLPSMLMDHEAESLMNPEFFDILEMVKDAGIFDIWLHTNANMLTGKLAERLIDGGITKINFSIDATEESTYRELRVGGKYQRVLENVHRFLNMKIEKKADYLRTRVSFVVQDANREQKMPFFGLWKKSF